VAVRGRVDAWHYIRWFTSGGGPVKVVQQRPLPPPSPKGHGAPIAWAHCGHSCGGLFSRHPSSRARRRCAVVSATSDWTDSRRSGLLE